MNLIPKRKADQINALSDNISQATLDRISVRDLSVGTLNAVMNLGSGASIQSAASGTRIQITAAEIAGYNGSTKQFYLSAADGKAYCGGGKVILDSGGVKMYGNSISLTIYDNADALVGYVYSGSADTLSIVSYSGKKTLVSGDTSVTLNTAGTLYLIAASGGIYGIDAYQGGFIRLPAGANAYGTPATEGHLIYDYVAHVMKYHNGTAVKTIGNAYTEIAPSGLTPTTVGNNWETWDISAIVPAGTSVVEIMVSIVSAPAGYKIGARKYGTSTDRSIVRQVSNLTLMLCQVSTDRKIDVLSGEYLGVSYIGYSIIGYWL